VSAEQDSIGRSDATRRVAPRRDVASASYGFCLVNDVALATARLCRDALMHPALTVDLDLHQGDGNKFTLAFSAVVLVLTYFLSGPYLGP
jgi:acetoin utilization deacetylase AcuC-like enzyme